MLYIIKLVFKIVNTKFLKSVDRNVLIIRFQNFWKWSVDVGNVIKSFSKKGNVIKLVLING